MINPAPGARTRRRAFRAGSSMQLIHMGKLQTMNATQGHSAISIMIFAMVAFNGIFLAVSDSLCWSPLWHGMNFTRRDRYGLLQSALRSRHWDHSALLRHGVRNRHDPAAVTALGCGPRRRCGSPRTPFPPLGSRSRHSARRRQSSVIFPPSACRRSSGRRSSAQSSRRAGKAYA